MRASLHRICAFSWLVTGLVAATAPGCGCPRVQPNSPTAKASDEPKDSDQPKEESAKEPSRKSEPVADGGDTPPHPTEPIKKDEATDKSNTASAPTKSGATAARVPGSATDQTVPQIAPAKPIGDPRDAKRKARELSAAARNSAGKRNYSQAFREARAGWEAVSQFPQDAECQGLTKSLLQQMATFGSKANAEVEVDTTKPLVVE